NPLGPAPMRQEMGHWPVRTPMCLVKVKPILLKAGQVEDAEIGTPGWHVNLAEFLQFLFHARLFVRVGEIQQVAGVAVVGGWLAQVVKACPDELPGREGE